jgi:acyl-CoA dehydrogenase
VRRLYSEGLNHLDVDPVVRALAERLVPADEVKRLREIGQLVGTSVLSVGAEVDEAGSTALVTHDLSGRWVQEAVLSRAHRELLEQLRPMIAVPFTGAGFLAHLLEGYLVADPGLFCAITLSTQVASALWLLHPAPDPYLERLWRGPSFGATWFTEVHAGSDLAATRTVAHAEGDRFVLKGGDKYFASAAGLADLALAAAYVDAPGPIKELALFLVPAVREDGSPNIRVRALKRKLATRGVPTGEVELEGSEAIMLAPPGEGIYRILQSLTQARVANCVASAGITRIAALEATLRASERCAFGRPIGQHALVARDLLELRLEHLGTTATALLVAEVFDRAWKDLRDPEYLLLRVLGHIAKVATAEASARATNLAMEVFGGLGFIEDFGIARWHREALVLPIWEGTSNIHARDAGEALGIRGAYDALRGLLEQYLPATVAPSALAAADWAAKELREEEWEAKQALRRLGQVLECAALGWAARAVGALGEVAELRWRQHSEGALPRWQLAGELAFSR